MKISLKDMALISLFTALIAIGAFIKINIGPVPYTLQVFFIFMALNILGGYRAFISIVLYLLLGLIGIPIFTEGGGIYYVLKPTFGFLLGFLLMALTYGIIERAFRKKESFKDNEVKFMIANNIISMIPLYIAGSLYFYFIMNFYVAASEYTYLSVLKLVVLPFIIWTVIEAIVSAIISLRIKKKTYIY